MRWKIIDFLTTKSFLAKFSMRYSSTLRMWPMHLSVLVCTVGICQRLNSTVPTLPFYFLSFLLLIALLRNDFDIKLKDFTQCVYILRYAYPFFCLKTTIAFNFTLLNFYANALSFIESIDKKEERKAA